MPFFIISLFVFLQTATTGVEVQVYNAAVNEPVAGVHVVLETFTYQDGEAFQIEKQTCTTDKSGSCTLLLLQPNTNGLQRGTLQIGEHGSRDVVWPGGMLSLSLPLDQLGFGREAAPYEHLPEDGGVLVHRGRFPLYALLMVLFWGVLLVVAYRYAKRQEISQ